MNHAHASTYSIVYSVGEFLQENLNRLIGTQGLICFCAKNDDNHDFRFVVEEQRSFTKEQFY